MSGCATAADSDAAWQDMGPPVLQAASFLCDADRVRWELQADVLSWSAGGRAWLTRDARYVELHEVPSVSAARDGSADTLRARLTVVADFRLVDPGSSTAFVCDEPPAVLFEIFGYRGHPSACAGRGDAWENLPDRPDCQVTAF